MGKWRDASTAPKDGTTILLYLIAAFGRRDQDRFVFAHWSGWGGGIWSANAGKYEGYAVTHWQPLPKPPAGEEEIPF